MSSEHRGAAPQVPQFLLPRSAMMAVFSLSGTGSQETQKNNKQNLDDENTFILQSGWEQFPTVLGVKRCSSLTRPVLENKNFQLHKTT